MEPIELTTPSGYQVFVKPDLTYGQYLELQELVTSNVSVDLEKSALEKVSGSFLIKASRKVLEYVVVKVLDPKGVEVSNPIETVLNLPRTDGDVISEKINSITASVFNTQKKGAK